MKLSTIAKTSLALGILTTGVITTNAQSVDAAASSIQNQQSPETLFEYYNKTGHDLRNIEVGYRDGDRVNVIDRGVHTEVDLLGNDKLSINDDFLKSKFDVFVVGEGTGKKAPTRSIGGITKPNSIDYNDQVSNPQLIISHTDGPFTATQYDGPFNIYKEQVSLKELDFKLRKKLIDEHGLYKNGPKNGTIVVKMNSGREDDKYSFELDKKLQDHRMGDVVDSKNIKEIIVEFK
ncbi:exotoxin beta-grasp domain-containing protein [Staphylococcus agnetis]|uniref:exotoxin beta-grasp domain-containing protein n=1 Tax=Staphylococcus agnetis TaxID=985762 RepID=UPI000D02BA70|nr:superantigen-like protein [Staphylococcus agnetis]